MRILEDAMRYARIRKLLLVIALAFLVISCGPAVKGTYSNVNGAIVLDVKSGHKASFSIAGDSRECTYNVDGGKLMLDCQGDKVVFTIHDDGSLSGPPDSLMGAMGTLRKAKS